MKTEGSEEVEKGREAKRMRREREGRGKRERETLYIMQVSPVRSRERISGGN